MKISRLSARRAIAAVDQEKARIETHREKAATLRLMHRMDQITPGGLRPSARPFRDLLMYLVAGLAFLFVLALLVALVAPATAQNSRSGSQLPEARL